MLSKCNVSCINLIKYILIWLCQAVGVALLADGFEAVPAGSQVVPDGCRVIPAGHFNFDPAMVEALGGKDARDAVTKAIIYEKINGWILHYESKGRDYVFNNIDQWAVQIPFWHAGTIRKHIKSLVEDGHIDRIRPSATAPSRYKKPITKDSDSANQMSLWGEQMIPTVATKESDSSIHNPTIQNPSTNKQPPATPARARKSKPQNVGVVAAFPHMDERSKDVAEPKPQVAEARPGNEDFDRAHDANAPTPSAAPPPSEWSVFFDGCSPEEVGTMLDCYGEPLLKDARNYALANASIFNPAGFVREQLAKGWRPPQPMQQTRYTSGTYAAFIHS